MGLGIWVSLSEWKPNQKKMLHYAIKIGKRSGKTVLAVTFGPWIFFYVSKTKLFFQQNGIDFLLA